MTNLKNDSATRASQGESNQSANGSFEIKYSILVFLSFPGNIAQTETLVLNVSGRILMVNKETNGNATEHLVSHMINRRTLHAAS